jgi:phosphinothricin acetyltransferase
MSIRTASPGDASAMCAIYGPIVRTTHISFEIGPPTVEEMRLRIQAKLADLPWLVSVDGVGKVNGYAHASKLRDRAAYQWSAEVTVYVHESARRSGVGRRLYLRLFETLAELGYFQAFAGIALPNAGSVALHEAVGFQPIGIYRKVGFKFGEWVDVGWWQKELAKGVPSQPPKSFKVL